MRILLDHCVPKPLRRHLESHEVRTTAEMHWEDLKNGKLLSAAGARFDVLLTVDKNVKSQQNLNALPVAVVVLVAKTNRLEDLQPLMAYVGPVFDTIRRGQLIEILADGRINVIV